jgi:hypothetical protein
VHDAVLTPPAAAADIGAGSVAVGIGTASGAADAADLYGLGRLCKVI